MDWRYILVHYGIYSGGVGINWILLYIYLDAFDFDSFLSVRLFALVINVSQSRVKSTTSATICTIPDMGLMLFFVKQSSIKPCLIVHLVAV